MHYTSSLMQQCINMHIHILFEEVSLQRAEIFSGLVGGMSFGVHAVWFKVYTGFHSVPPRGFIASGKSRPFSALR